MQMPLSTVVIVTTGEEEHCNEEVFQKISQITFLPDFVDDFFESVRVMMMVKVTIHLNANGPAVFV